MNATDFRPSLSTRLAALAVAGMQPHDETASTQVIALERVTVRATPVN